MEKLFTKEKWERVKTHPYYSEFRKNVITKADEFLLSEPPRIKYSDIHSYYVTGHRSDYSSQGNYTTRMNTFFNAYMLTEDEKYITPLVDVIWNICDFECWTGPWHVSESRSLEERFMEMDLGSTSLGGTLAQILYFVGDKLPELVYRRAKDQVYRRIIKSFETHKDEDIYWFHRTTNWSAFCINAVFTCYFYLATREETMAQIPRMLKSIECYLRGLDDEGCCIEGYGYWAYGFGAFCEFAEKLREYTDGEIDLFKKEKVHTVALFQQKIAMNDHECLSFSDCGRKFKPYAPLSHLLKSVYSDVEIPSIEAFNSPSAGSIREILYQNPDYVNCEFKPKSHGFKYAQWFVYHIDKYSLGAKAGHNKETHNHNDVGSFMFSKDGKISFCDLGGGEYVQGYFGAGRYNFLVCSSRGHSVPIINGQYQASVDNKSTVYEQTDKTFAFSMENVYGIETLKSLKRTFVCEDGSVVLTDKYEFSLAPDSVVERFVSDLPIIVDGSRLVCNNTTLEFDPELFDVEVIEEKYAVAAHCEGTAYLADLKVKKPSTNMEFRFVIE